MLAPVRTSLAENRPLRWRRVHNLPDYVYFDHSVHVDERRRLRDLPWARGPDAADAAGRRRSRWAGASTATATPTPHLRPREAVFDMAWTPPKNQADEGRRLRGAYHIDTKHLTDCSICHR